MRDSGTLSVREVTLTSVREVVLSLGLIQHFTQSLVKLLILSIYLLNESMTKLGILMPHPRQFLLPLLILVIWNYRTIVEWVRHRTVQNIGIFLHRR